MKRCKGDSLPPKVYWHCRWRYSALGRLSGLDFLAFKPTSTLKIRQEQSLATWRLPLVAKGLGKCSLHVLSHPHGDKTTQSGPPDRLSM